MPSTSRTAAKNAAHAFALFSLLTTAAFAQIARSPDGSIMELHGHQLHKRANTYVGCFSSSAPLSVANTYQYQSSGYCGQHCNKAVIGLTGGDTCLCGDQIPAKSSKVDDSKCSNSCDGYGEENCGGDGFYTVYTTGTEDNVPYYSGGSSSSSEESSTASPTTDSSATSATKAPTSTLAVITSEVAQGSTVVITAYQPVPTASDASTSSNNGGGGGGTSTAGVAAGVVVGVVALAGIVAGLFFFLRHKKRQQAEADFKQRTQVADFMRGANERKPPGTGYSGMSDQRLDPEAGARRNSVGSLADNQDYSRRILRVANPDSS